MRKALQTEQGKNEMEGRIQTLEGEVKDLERQVRSREWNWSTGDVAYRSGILFQRQKVLDGIPHHKMDICATGKVALPVAGLSPRDVQGVLSVMCTRFSAVNNWMDTSVDSHKTSASGASILIITVHACRCKSGSSSVRRLRSVRMRGGRQRPRSTR
jgi:hypothetical protein